jgi:hypothetical protein
VKTAIVADDGIDKVASLVTSLLPRSGVLICREVRGPADLPALSGAQCGWWRCFRLQSWPIEMFALAKAHRQSCRSRSRSSERHSKSGPQALKISRAVTVRSRSGEVGHDPVVAGLEDLPVLQMRDRAFDRGAEPVDGVVVCLLLIGQLTAGWFLGRGDGASALVAAVTDHPGACGRVVVGPAVGDP